MSFIPLVAVAVVTNGDSAYLNRSFEEWTSEGFAPGRTLFFCGPRQRLLDKGIAAESIVDYVDPPYYRNNFHINEKKRAACCAINAKYIYLVHDRFIPKTGLFEVLTQALSGEDIDFGAMDVDNQDGTAALRELRLKRAAASTSLEPALERMGRLTCEVIDPEASDRIAVNGGQFFIRKSISTYLSRPMRWLEMEDDVLSHDLLAFRGRWLKACGLLTLVHRRAPESSYLKSVRLKYKAYGMFCNFIAALTSSISVGQRLDCQQLHSLLSRRFLLVDPLHKFASSDFLPSSLEKIMTRARIASDGKSWVSVEKHPLGWKLIGHQDVQCDCEAVPYEKNL